MSVTFEGQIDSVLGGFYCLRGFTTFDKIASYSKADPSYQRDLISEHKNEMRDFLRSGSYVFFPEVILSYSIKTKDNLSLSQIISNKGKSTPLHIQKNKTTLTLEDEEKLDRIDGNHRLEAFEKNKGVIDNFKVPFCIILLDGSEDDLKKKNIIFHNINFKQIPLTKEKSLEILFKEDVYSDNELKSMGLEYLITKKVLDKIEQNKTDYKKLPFDYSTVQKRTFMYNAIRFLIENTELEREYNRDSEKEIDRILKCLQDISKYYQEEYKTEGSSAMFSFLLYYQYKESTINPHTWLLQNCIHNISDYNLQPESLIILYESALKNKASNMWETIKCWAGLIWKTLGLIRKIQFWKNK